MFLRKLTHILIGFSKIIGKIPFAGKPVIQSMLCSVYACRRYNNNSIYNAMQFIGFFAFAHLVVGFIGLNAYKNLEFSLFIYQP